MSRSRRYSYCMTLRLEPSMETELADLAYAMRRSKAAAIRGILGRAIAQEYAKNRPDEAFQSHGGEL